MSEQRIDIYEGMFLFPQSAAADFAGVIEHIHEILNRAEAEVIAMKKWDERRLAYDIKGNKRGLYILTYFKADRTKLAGIERDCNLSELLLRSLVLRADHIPTEEIEAADERQALADEATLRKEEAAAEVAKQAAAAEAAAEAAALAPVAVAEETVEATETVEAAEAVEATEAVESASEEKAEEAPEA
jgi:small subunit ribosomal protein S6